MEIVIMMVVVGMRIVYGDGDSGDGDDKWR
jgi:hypothetical protein